MRILILGGTRFLGRHIVSQLVDAGHEVTLFNRGRSNPELFPDIERIHGDRDGGLAGLEGRSWDVAIDTCGYLPRLVRASAELLASSIGRYIYISTLSVYPDFMQPGKREDAPVWELDDPTVEELTAETYGALKALCERAAEEAMPGRVLNVRAGLVVGPYDPTDRFTYWPMRFKEEGAVLAPGNPDAHIQFIDARDLAEWIELMARTGGVGTYNVTGAAGAVTMRALVEECRTATGSNEDIVWIDESFLLERGVEPWSQIPLWVPPTPEFRYFADVDSSRAIADGLRFRSLRQTIDDTLAWATGRPADYAMRVGIERAIEQELIEEWRRGLARRHRGGAATIRHLNRVMYAPV